MMVTNPISSKKFYDNGIKIKRFAIIVAYGKKSFAIFLGQRRSSVAGLTEDDRQTVDKERQVGDPMQLRTEVLNL